VTDGAKEKPMKDKSQMEFQETHRFVSACVHCGKPMQGMSIDRYESVGPGQVEQRDVYRVWIDPEHDCSYLSITVKEKAAA
jgi:ribosomal protein L34E